MTRVLLTGGSGFIAAHVLDTLLARGHSVVTTVRSQAKADAIAKTHSSYGKDKLDFAIVEDIAQPGAFDKAVVSDPPFEAVIHTASPFHFNVTDTKKDLLDPAINGTVGILKAIQASAPSVTRVVITSSFAAIVNPKAPATYTYSEKDWNPVTEAEATQDPSTGYRASKKLAEEAAWHFLERERPNFTIATCNPPLVLGPVAPWLASLSGTNTSNERIRDIINGSQREKLRPTGVFLWVDVRDIAEAHVLAAEKAEAANKRFFVVQGHFSNADIVEIVRKNFPNLREGLPEGDALGPGKLPKEVMQFDNSRSVEVLGLKYRGLEESIVDTVKSMESVAA